MYFGAFVTIGARRVSGVLGGREDTLRLVTLPLIGIFVIFFFYLLATFFNRRDVHGVHSAAGLVVTYG